MAGLVIIDKKPRDISAGERGIVNQLIRDKYINVSVANNKETESQTETFLRKIAQMRHELSTLSRAKKVADKLEEKIRSDDGEFSKAQISGGPKDLMDLL